jgi:hypothetical protein
MRLYLFTHRKDDDKTLLEHLTIKSLLKTPYVVSNTEDKFNQILVVAQNKKEATTKITKLMEEIDYDLTVMNQIDEI